METEDRPGGAGAAAEGKQRAEEEGRRALNRKRPATGRTTIKDVAAALGVSVMTVSNAYNRPDQIAPATRARVLAEAARLGYPGPHPTARSLRRRRTGVIAVLSTTPLSYTFSDPAAVLFTQGISVSSEAAHVGLLLLSESSPEDPSVVSDAAVDGIIAAAIPANDPLLEAARRRRLPLVLVDGPPLPDVPRVGIDDEGGARAAAEHLLALGHRRIGVVALGEVGVEGEPGTPLIAPREQSSFPVSRARLRGYAEALEAAGVLWSETPVYACPYNSPSDGAAAARALLTLEPRPTALLLMSDQLALGAVNMARSLGLRVPQDVSVVGFDDVPVAKWMEPGLTTIHQPHIEKGRRAAEVLLAALQSDGTRQAVEIVLPTHLLVRASTAPPPGRP